MFKPVGDVPGAAATPATKSDRNRRNKPTKSNRTRRLRSARSWVFFPFGGGLDSCFKGGLVRDEGAIHRVDRPTDRPTDPIRSPCPHSSPPPPFICTPPPPQRFEKMVASLRCPTNWPRSSRVPGACCEEGCRASSGGTFMSVLSRYAFRSYITSASPSVK